MNRAWEEGRMCLLADVAAEHFRAAEPSEDYVATQHRNLDSEDKFKTEFWCGKRRRTCLLADAVSEDDGATEPLENSLGASVGHIDAHFRTVALFPSQIRRRRCFYWRLHILRFLRSRRLCRSPNLPLGCHLGIPTLPTLSALRTLSNSNCYVKIQTYVWITIFGRLNLLLAVYTGGSRERV